MLTRTTAQTAQRMGGNYASGENYSQMPETAIRPADSPQCSGSLVAMQTNNVTLRMMIAKVHMHHNKIGSIDRLAYNLLLLLLSIDQFFNRVGGFGVFFVGVPAPRVVPSCHLRPDSFFIVRIHRSLGWE